MTTAQKQKLLSDFHDVESEVTSLNSNSYPDNFYVGQAIGNGSCFFDSFRQSLEQQTGEQVTVEKLRNDCREFAQKNPPEWFIDAIANSYDNNGQRRNETVSDYTANIMNNSRWGDSDIEGRILCEKYGVKLHVVESNPLRAIDIQQDRFLHQLIDNSGSKNAGEYNKVDYDDSSIVHVINKGGLHFEPLLDRNKSLAKQLQEEAKLKQEQEQEDFLLAKELQLDEILEYCNLSKDISERAEVEKRFDELLAKNADGKIMDVAKQCAHDITQRIEHSEKQNPSSSPRCSMEESRTEKTFHQQQISQLEV
ncbi:OTU domain-containing protein [Wolbachia endosymbiont (group A) of Trypoxylon clavicerum]|uniref:hypothetical protein n=1 Tax=Wolbachia endosymbiont (group A) of Trypoxylon clavicerum TaxID=2954064 RepID=UPI00222FBFB6|nr:hypothetical protein [Wolbachia endosymbiont (group A) of Trypoxylon clavicerum]